MSSDPAFSLVYLTYRPGGIDLLAQSLICQEANYELLVIDGFPGRPERGEATEFLLAHGLPLTHFVTPKQKAYPDTPLNLANAMNTGALLARAPWVVYLHDYSAVLPRTLAALERKLLGLKEQNVLISGVADIHRSKPPQQAGDVSVWKKHKPLARRLKGRPVSWIPEEFENFFCAVPMRFMELTNGIDERADGHISWPLLCMTTQAKLHGWRLEVDRGLRVQQVDHHGWGGSVWHAENVPTGVPSGTLALQFAPEWDYISKNPYDFVAEWRLHS